jgi:Transposase DDE domain
LPFKANADRRHRIPKQRHRVTNWAEYDAALRARGSLTVWLSEEAIAAWRAPSRTTRGGQPSFSPLAIATALTLRAVFRLALRQTEGLIRSILQLLGLDLAVPDHSTLSRRAETLELPKPRSSPGSGPVHLLVDSTGLRLCGPGEWLAEKHGGRTRRSWRKLHVGVDADTGRIVAATLTPNDVDDGSQVGPLLDQTDGLVASFTADGAFDRDDVYAEVAARHPDGEVIVPPRASAVPSETAETAPTRRDRHIAIIAERGRLGWQKASGYNWRALVEADIARFKRVIGDALRSRTDGRRATEVAIAVAALNRMLDLGRPEYVRIA